MAETPSVSPVKALYLFDEPQGGMKVLLVLDSKKIVQEAACPAFRD
jgi:hypothetical protein